MCIRDRLYDPGSDNWNSKWHRLHVTCERKGVKVQLRERYYAVADARSAVDRNRAALMAGFQSPGDFAGIGLRVKFAPLDGKEMCIRDRQITALQGDESASEHIAYVGTAK